MKTALNHAGQGKMTLLVSQDTCLYSEISLSADYRPPKSLKAKDAELLFPEDVLDDDGMLHPDRLKKHGEKLLAAKGVQLLYACQCVSLTGNTALIAHKSGLFQIEYEQAFDCRGQTPLHQPCFCLQYVLDGKRGQIQVPMGEAEDTYLFALGELMRQYPLAKPSRSGNLPSDTGGIRYLPTGFMPIPAREENADIIVAGGGTAGAVAALRAARLGMRTLLIEMNNCLGGTATVGGVSSYWFGLRAGASAEIDEAVDGLYKRFGIPRKPHIWTQDDVFLPDIKAYVLKSLCEQAGVTIRFGATVCAVNREKNRVTGVRYAQGGTLHTAACRMVIDCTGDGDCCVFAGADYHYGSERDEMTYWASLAQYPSPDSYRNNFSTMVRVDDPLDYTRFIVSGRLRGSELYDHGQYVAVRESRHIRGMETVTLEGILGMCLPARTLYTCFSNYDPKGRLTADLVYFGLLPPNQMIPIPRGAVIPTDSRGHMIEGLLVGGKAISCTHDAFPGIRMQPDLQQQGLALGVLAAECLREDKDAWSLGDISRQIMAAGGYLPECPVQTEPDYQEIINGLRGDEPLEWLDAPTNSYQASVQPIISLFLADSAQILPLLQSAYSCMDRGSRRLLLARLLLWHRDERGAMDIIEEIYSLLRGEPGLPRRSGSVQYGQMLPDHGLMPEAVYLLNSLSRTRNTKVIALFELVLSRLMRSKRDWYDLRAGIYCYVESFAFVARGREDRDFLPLLRALCGLDEFAANQEDDLLTERFGMLRITLLDAMWHLRDKYGQAGLEEMTRSSRRALAVAAAKLLEK